MCPAHAQHGMGAAPGRAAFAVKLSDLRIMSRALPRWQTIPCAAVAALVADSVTGAARRNSGVRGSCIYVASRGVLFKARDAGMRRGLE